MQALWQGAPYGHLFIWNGLLIGVIGPGAPEVRAVNAMSGALVWRTRLSRKDPYVLGLLPGDGIAMVEVGHCTPGSDVVHMSAGPVLDLRTGRQLWTVPLFGTSLTPPAAMTGNLIVIADSYSVIRARNARTGAQVWRKAPPGGCSPASAVDNPVYLAADGSLLVVSYSCGDLRAMVQRVTASTGQVVWEWRSPGAYTFGNARPYGSFTSQWLWVVGAARQGSVVLLSGGNNQDQSPASLVGNVPTYTWPDSLGLARAYGYLVALDATSGVPRWMEVGAAGLDYPFDWSFTLTSGVVCQAVSLGVECRDDVTGALSRPVIVTGRKAGSAQDGDRWAGITGSVVAVTMGRAYSRQVSLVVLPVRAGPVVAQTSFSLGPTLPPPPPEGCAPNPCYDADIVGAGPLPDGSTLLLLRRVDLPGFPALAIRVS